MVMKNNSTALEIDRTFATHFRNLKQVFLYITDECNLRCLQCLYKPSLILGRTIEQAMAARLIYTFRKMGAFKLTLLGGEVSQYGRGESWRPLFDVIRFSKEAGYSYVRIDTNGQFSNEFLDSPELRLLDEISFSLDGYDSLTNDCLRGMGTFSHALRQIQRAADLGYNIQITTCVTPLNSRFAGSVSLFLDRMVRFAESLKVTAINFHGVFKMGVPMDTWTEGCHLEPKEWMEGFDTISEKIKKGDYGIHVRLPAHIIRKSEFERNPKYFGYCPCKLGERVLVHPNGLIRICSSMLCTAYCVARYDKESIRWETVTNELYRHDITANTPCTNQRDLYKDGFVPVCFSLKPKQEEPVWKTLGYDSRFKAGAPLSTISGVS
jgi:MoaA/NifB/PqqE/SkfB family radical SAM enzyme